MGDAVRDRQIWLFNAADFSGNPKWLFHFVSRFRDDLDAYWIADSPAVVRRIRSLGYQAIPFTGAGSLRIQRAAGVFVVNQVKERIPAAMRGIVLLNLWHGVGVKRVERAMTTGMLLPRIAAKYIRNNKAYRDTQLFLVTSPMMETHFREQIGFDESQVIRAGYPQNTLPRTRIPMTTFEHELRTGRGLSAQTNVVLYAPTYRLSGNAGFLTRALPDFDALVRVLEENDQLLILKMHPQLVGDRAYRELERRYGQHPRLLFWDNAHDVYEVFDQIDTAIVDYSSIHYDLIAAGVTSFIRYVYDLDAPTALEPGLDYLELSRGTIATDFPALLTALSGDNRVAEPELDELRERFWSYDDDASIERIIEHALQYVVRDVELPTLYSFDVFDTVMHRRAVRPVSIFLAVRREIARAGDEFPQFLAQRFVEVRQQSEAAVREGLRKDPRRAAGAEFEITFDSIYERIGRLFDLDRTQLDRIKAWEVEYELRDVVPDAEIVARVRELHEAGERVILISDMYLPRPVIARMLERADPLLAELPLYLSSELGVQKSTKQLYLRAFVDVGYDFERWVHTGDNAHADIRMAAELGITTVKLATPVFDAYEQAMANTIGSYDGYLLAGMLREQRFGELSQEELFAYRTAALYLVPYVLWAVQDAVGRGYETLYFISRDGHLLHRIAERCIEELGLPLKTRYIYGSRRAWRLASQLDGIDDDTFAPHGSFGGIRSFAGLVEASRLDERELLALFPEFAKFRAAGSFNAHEAAGIVETMRASHAYRGRLAEIANADRALTTAYLAQEIDFGERFAFVEYWGRGYTQDCLVRLFESMGIGTGAPFYYARSIYPSATSAERHNYTSASYSLLLIEAIFANLPYGTTEGYERIDDRLVPRISPRAHNPELLDAMERLMPAFAADFLALPAFDHAQLARDAFRFGFEHFRTQPGFTDYVELIAPLRDAVELGGLEREFAPALRLRDLVAFLRGKPISEITRSFPISMKRSRGLAPRLFRLQREVGFRRVLKRLRQRIGGVVPRRRNRPEPAAPGANPPSAAGRPTA
ncbi:CDP-glycerol glycerophosphotransferase family protein [Agromyces sp. NPDC060279]|uniref:CDP-glycerol glycerophosphotransferase family protein n=1 Tax=Agromyces sp. NPDC060279 TaxID=3347092 RepID=UPI003658A14F